PRREQRAPRQVRQCRGNTSPEGILASGTDAAGEFSIAEGAQQRRQLVGGTLQVSVEGRDQGGGGGTEASEQGRSLTAPAGEGDRAQVGIGSRQPGEALCAL